MTSKLAFRMKRIADVARYACSSRRSAYYCGWIGYRNLGDEAMYQAVAESFRPLKVVGCKSPSSSAVLRKLMERKRHAATILGGGTMIVRPDGDASPHFFDKFQAAHERYGRGIVFGTGVGRTREVEKDLARWKPLLEKCLYVGVRGPDSKETLERLGISCEVIGDPAAHFVKSAGPWSPEGNCLGVNYGHLHAGAYDERQAPLDKAVAEFLRQRLAEGWSVEFYCIWPADKAVIQEVARQAGIQSPVIREHYEDPAGFLEHARRLRAFIGMKLHSVILALCAGVPATMIAYQYKCYDFMKSVGMEEFCLGLDQVQSSVARACVDRMGSDAAQISQRAAAALVGYRRKQLEVAAKLRQAVLEAATAENPAR